MKTIEDLIQFAKDNGYDNRSTLFENFWLREWFDNVPNWDFESYYDWLMYPTYYTFTPNEEQIIWYTSVTNIIISKPFMEAIARGIEKREEHSWFISLYWEEYRVRGGEIDELIWAVWRAIIYDKLDELIKDILPKQNTND